MEALGYPDLWEMVPKAMGDPAWLAAAEEAAEGVAYLVMNDPEALAPKTVHEALSGANAKQWRKALDAEMSAMVEQGVWDPEPVKLPPGKTAVDSKVIFTYKRDEQGKVYKYKARLVARGFSQVPGLDYGDTFVAVARMASVRMMLALATEHDMEVHLSDVQRAFLNASLQLEVYLKQPKGADDGTSRVLRLRKAIYGLKQSPREWSKELKSKLTQRGFSSPISDQAIFMRLDPKVRAYVATWVDDLLIVADHLRQVELVKAELGESFSIKDLGEATMYLGVNIARDRKARVLDLCLKRYITLLEQRFKEQLAT